MSCQRLILGTPTSFRCVNLRLHANSPGPLTPLHPLMLHPGGIEHFIKTGRGLGSNVTVLSRSLSIPPWPFAVFNFAGCQAWPCRRMEGTQRSHAVRATQWQLSHKPWKSRPFSAPQQFNYYPSMLELPALKLRIRWQMMMSNHTSLIAFSSLIHTYFLCGVSMQALYLNNKWRNIEKNINMFFLSNLFFSMQNFGIKSFPWESNYVK